jgi:hypothetical protein
MPAILPPHIARFAGKLLVMPLPAAVAAGYRAWDLH